MHVSEFLPFAGNFANQCLETLHQKTAEYATNGDHMSHIEDTAAEAGTAPVVVWKIFFQKHYIALKKLLDYYDDTIIAYKEVDEGDAYEVNEQIAHRITDMINYLLMLAAVFPTQEEWDKIEANREILNKIMPVADNP